MPERVSKLAEQAEQLVTVLGLASFGVAIGLSQVMLSRERPPLGVWVGRAISTGGLASAAGMVLLWYPDAPLSALIGVAAALATLGTAGLERLFQRVMEGRNVVR